MYDGILSLDDLKREWKAVVPEGFTPAGEDQEWDVLGPSRYRLVGASPMGEEAPRTSIGGLCLLYSGDISYLSKGQLPSGERIESVDDVIYWAEKTLPRIDQIMDCVGPSNTEDICVVFEDNLFADLLAGFLGAPEEKAKLEKAMRCIGERSIPVLNKWLSMCNGRETNVTPVFTSDIWPELQRAVYELGEEMEAPSFTKRAKSPVNLMYTYKWPELLKRTGYIQDERVVCIEPFEHFLEQVGDDYNQTSPFLSEYIRANPWGVEGKQKDFIAAGYIPALKPFSAIKRGKSKFSRYVKSSSVVNGANPGQAELNGNVFPLCNNEVFRLGLELAYSNPEYRNIIMEARRKESEYRGEIKALGKSPEAAPLKRELKERYRTEVSGMLEALCTGISTIYRELGFGGLA